MKCNLEILYDRLKAWIETKAMDYPEQRSDLGDGQDGKGAGNGSLFHDGRDRSCLVRDTRKTVICYNIGTFEMKIKRSGEKRRKIPRLPPLSVRSRLVDACRLGSLTKKPAAQANSDSGSGGFGSLGYIKLDNFVGKWPQPFRQRAIHCKIASCQLVSVPF